MEYDVDINGDDADEDGTETGGAYDNDANENLENALGPPSILTS
jgi:hypothetical protein